MIAMAMDTLIKLERGEGAGRALRDGNDGIVTHQHFGFVMNLDVQGAIIAVTCTMSARRFEIAPPFENNKNNTKVSPLSFHTCFVCRQCDSGTNRYK